MSKPREKRAPKEPALDAVLDRYVKVANESHISETDLVVKILGRMHEAETQKRLESRFKNGKPQYNGDAGP